MMKVDLHIEELVLHGVAPGDRFQVGEALRRELARLIAGGGVPAGLAAGGAFPRLDGGSFQAAPGASPETYGSGAARAVYEGMRR